MNNKKIIGIIGGMGPLATVDLFSKIVELTDAKTDSEHIHIIIDNYPQIPDRTKAILAGTKEPVVPLREAALRLQTAGADLIIIPCNTSHVFIDDVQAAVDIPIINMVEEVSTYLKAHCITTCGVLTTDGVRKTGLYTEYLSKQGIKAIYPDESGQKTVMEIIYDQVKAGKPVHLDEIYPKLDDMVESGAQAFILACTELPIAFKDADKKYNFVDCTDVLATVSIQKAGYQVKACKEKQ